MTCSIRKVKAFVQSALFDRAVDLADPNTLRNLSELAATKTVLETFKRAINALTIQDKGDAEIRDCIKLRQTRPFVAKDQGYLIPKKSVFNRIIGDSHFELVFARFLEDCTDVISYAKNYLAVHFRAGLRQCRRRHLQLLPGLFRQTIAQAHLHRRNQRSGRPRRTAQNATPAPMVRRRQPRPVGSNLRLRLRRPGELRAVWPQFVPATQRRVPGIQRGFVMGWGV